jgi:hypothetical protein
MSKSKLWALWSIDRDPRRETKTSWQQGFKAVLGSAVPADLPSSTVGSFLRAVSTGTCTAAAMSKRERLTFLGPLTALGA